MHLLWSRWSYTEQCYQLNGFPPTRHKIDLGLGSSLKPRAHQVSTTSSFPSTLDQCQQLLAILNNVTPEQSMVHQVGSTEQSLACMSSILSDDSLWILDSGATNHMVCCPIALSQSYPIYGCTVQLRDGSYASITHIGYVTLSPSLVLHNVLCFSTFHFNLIFVRTLCRTLCCLIIFSYDFCFIQDSPFFLSLSSLAICPICASSLWIDCSIFTLIWCRKVTCCLWSAINSCCKVTKLSTMLSRSFFLDS